MHIRAPLYVKVYVFNVTNADEVAAGSEELVLQELGPYVYQDHREKIIYDDDGQTITYLPQSLFEFIPAMSGDNLNLSDLITTVNIPLLVSICLSHFFFLQLPITTLIRLQQPWSKNFGTCHSSPTQ